MRKLIFSAVVLFAAVQAFAQPAKWYLSFSPGGGWGGPSGSLKNKFEKLGYNQTSTTVIFFLPFESDYPKVEHGVPASLRAGKHLKGNKSIFLVAGTSAAGEVRGYKNTGGVSYDFFGIFGGSAGTYISIQHQVTEVAIGLEHRMTNSRLSLGYAPAAFLLRYRNVHSSDGGKKTAFVPGVALTGRLPLGKEKRRIGMELVADLNLAPPATIKEQYDSYLTDNGTSQSKIVLPATKVNMVHGMVGLALTFRKK